jgi:hypothetical protein
MFLKKKQNKKQEFYELKRTKWIVCRHRCHRRLIYHPKEKERKKKGQQK